MKKILTFLILMPLVVTAAPTNFEITWDPYPDPTATIQALCGVNGSVKTLAGSTLASVTVLPINLDVSPGDTVACTAKAVKGPDASAESPEASVRLPFVLPPPVIHLRVVP